jgi:acyl dehydratase
LTSPAKRERFSAVRATLPPAADRHFEDYPVGAVFDLGTFTLAEDDIIAFAARYDPQSMHVDPDWAAQGPFGGVIASGWHSIAALMRLIVENFLPHNGLVSPGIDELRWLLPVLPGETLRAQVTVTAARRSRSRPDRGLVTGFVELLNQAGDPVLTMRPMNFIRCRPESLASSD